MLIGFAGKMGTGKTTLATMVEHMLHNINFHEVARISFGDAVKQEVSEKYGFPTGLCYSQEGKQTELDTKNIPTGLLPIRVRIDGEPLTVRGAMQFYATEIVRSLDDDYWVRKLAKVVLDEESPVRLFLIDDVRFPNEYKFVRRHGVCYSIAPYNGWQPGKYADHISETGLDGCQFDHIFRPDYGQLADRAENIVARIRMLYSV